MGILSRLNQVIKSNMNALVSETEDPEKLIAQTVLDMRAELKRASAELLTTLATSKRLDKEAEEASKEAAEWERKAIVALKAGDDALAREALKMKQKSSSKVDELKGRAAGQARAAEEMKATLESAEKRIADLEARKSTLAGQVRVARVAGSSPTGSPSSFDELERLSGKIDQLDAEVEVHNLIDDTPKRAELEARFRELEKSSGQSAVDDELAALKASLKD